MLSWQRQLALWLSVVSYYSLMTFFRWSWWLSSIPRPTKEDNRTNTLLEVCWEQWLEPLPSRTSLLPKQSSKALHFFSIVSLHIIIFEFYLKPHLVGLFRYNIGSWAPALGLALDKVFSALPIDIFQGPSMIAYMLHILSCCPSNAKIESCYCCVWCTSLVE